MSRRSRSGIGLDNRIGSKFLHAGPGYGGSCFPKDTLALIKTAQDYGSPMRLVETTGRGQRPAQAGDGPQGRSPHAAATSRGKKRRSARPDLQAQHRRHARIAVADDHPGAAGFAGAEISAYDPEGMDAAPRSMLDVTYAPDSAYRRRDAEALVIVTEWNAFRALDFDRLKAALRHPVVVDLRNIYRSGDMHERGFTYINVGNA
jgi:UDPglucose 6-dehydrogenase